MKALAERQDKNYALQQAVFMVKYPNMNRLKIVTGHFGSGKTEFAVNMALQSRGKTAILDMDTVNPYFRTADAEKVLTDKGIRVILPLFVNTNVDIPALTGEVISVFADKSTTAIFDVGGDDEGAMALGQYCRFFSEEAYDMYFIINTKRPLTREKDEIIAYLRAVEAASRLRVTHLVNCTHLGAETTTDIVLEGQLITEKVSRETGIPIGFTAVKKELADKIKVNNPVMGIELYIKFKGFF